MRNQLASGTIIDKNPSVPRTFTSRRRKDKERNVLKLDVEKARNPSTRYSEPHILVLQYKVFAVCAFRRDAYTPVVEWVGMIQQ
jgi:hypothetical protein